MSPSELVVRYLLERGRPRVLAPLALLLAAAGWIIARAGAGSWAQYLLASVDAFVLILAFRVWDDLEDRWRDTVEHPTRVLVAAGSVLPLVVLAAALALIGLAPIVRAVDPALRLVALGLASLVLFTWYRLRRTPSASVVGGHIVLVKYPAIALAVSPRIPGFNDGPALFRAAATLAAVYLVVCLYESVDDPALRASRAARGIAVAELALLVPLIAASVYFSSIGVS